MDNAVDKASGAVFPSSIEPARIARKAERQMKANRLVGAGRQYAPTLFNVLVSKVDDKRLFGFYPTMAAELETYLMAKGSDSGLHFDGRPLVRFISDEKLKKGRFDIIVEHVAAPIIRQLRSEEMDYYGLSPKPARSSSAPGAPSGASLGAGAEASMGAAGGLAAGGLAAAGAAGGLAAAGAADGALAASAADRLPERLAHAAQDGMGSQPHGGISLIYEADDDELGSNDGLDGIPGGIAGDGLDGIPGGVASGIPGGVAGGIPGDGLGDAPPSRVGRHSAASLGADLSGLEKAVSPHAAPTLLADVPAEAEGKPVSMGNAALIDLGSKAVYKLTFRNMLIGRDLSCDITLLDVNASRMHARLSQDAAGEWRLVDLDSTNGTLLNGQPVSQACLHDQDRVTIGTTKLVFRRS
jgi:hypothetical protein